MYRKPSGIALASAVLVFALSGCSSNDSSALSDAVYASHVPVFAHATFDGVIGGTSYGDTPGEAAEGRSWFFKTDRPYAEVLAFYDKQLAGWKRTEDDDGDGAYVTFQKLPQGAADGEYVQVTVRSGQVQVTESCKPGRTRRS